MIISIYLEKDYKSKLTSDQKNRKGYLAVEAIASCASGGSADDGTGKQ